MDMRPVRGWQASVALLVLAVVAFFLVAAAIWVLAVLAVLGACAWLSLVVMPRVSARLGVHPVVLDTVLLVGLIGGGWWIAGAAGGAIGGLVWLGGVAVPRVGVKWLQSRVRVHVVGHPETRGQALLLLPCPTCGVASADAGDRCPACGAALSVRN